MIAFDSLADIALLAESSDLECKKAQGRNGKGELPRDFWETYAAMANTDGGSVLLGIKQKKDEFELAGIEPTGKVKKDLFDTAINRSKVRANPGDMFDSPNLKDSSPNLQPSSPNLEDDSPYSGRNPCVRVSSSCYEVLFPLGQEQGASQPRSKESIPRHGTKASA